MLVKYLRLFVLVLIGSLIQPISSPASTQDPAPDTTLTKRTLTRIEMGSFDDLKGVTKVFVYAGDRLALRETVTAMLMKRHLKLVNDINQADVVILITIVNEEPPSELRLPAEYRDSSENGAVSDWTGAVLKRHDENTNRIVMRVSETTGMETAERLASEFLTAYDSVNK